MSSIGAVQSQTTTQRQDTGSLRGASADSGRVGGEQRDPRTVQYQGPTDNFSRGAGPGQGTKVAQAAGEGTGAPAGIGFGSPRDAAATPAEGQRHALQDSLGAVQDSHITGRSARDSAMSGIKELGKAGKLDFKEGADGRLHMSRNGRELDSFKMPKRDNDNIGWGNTMHDVGRSAAQHNPALGRSEGGSGVYNTMQRGITNGLDPHSGFMPEGTPRLHNPEAPGNLG